MVTHNTVTSNSLQLTYLPAAEGLVYKYQLNDLWAKYPHQLLNCHCIVLLQVAGYHSEFACYFNYFAMNFAVEQTWARKLPILGVSLSLSLVEVLFHTGTPFVF